MRVLAGSFLVGQELVEQVEEDLGDLGLLFRSEIRSDSCLAEGDLLDLGLPDEVGADLMAGHQPFEQASKDPDGAKVSGSWCAD
ncbi:hypothetical protein [Nonomuraea jabiensis]|uniref:hypothetical protein n=1 Tax=Nonomuraea jabiensis TaxID=882448 RepID=UPI003D7220F8